MYLGHHYQNNQLGDLGALGFFSKLKKILAAEAARKAAIAEAARIKAAVEAEVSKLVPTAEETAEAFVEEVKKISPPMPPEKPTVVTPPDSLLAPPPPVYTIPRGEVPARAVTTPVDSMVSTAPPAAVSAQFPLIEAYRRQQMQARAMPAADATPPGEAPPAEEKPGIGVGTVLALGIPLVLAMAG